MKISKLSANLYYCSWPNCIEVFEDKRQVDAHVDRIHEANKTDGETTDFDTSKIDDDFTFEPPKTERIKRVNTNFAFEFPKRSNKIEKVESNVIQPKKPSRKSFLQSITIEKIVTKEEPNKTSVNVENVEKKKVSDDDKSKIIKSILMKSNNNTLNKSSPSAEKFPLKKKIKDEGPVPCPICGKNFATKEKAKAHQKAKHESEEVVCEICSKKYKNRSILKAHLALHGEPAFHCAKCAKKFYNKAQLQNHEVKHEEPTFQCSSCDQMFYKKATLQIHEVKHGNPTFQCSQCEKSYYLKGDLKTHEITHTKVQCSECETTFASKARLKIHKRIFHLVDTLSCKFCGKKYGEPSKLKYHEEWHKGSLATVCTECNKNYRDPTSLKNHIKSFHLKERNFPCDKCSFKGFNIHKLRRHQENHCRFQEMKVENNNEDDEPYIELDDVEINQ